MSIVPMFASPVVYTRRSALDAQLRRKHFGIGQFFSDLTVQHDEHHPCWKTAHFLPCTSKMSKAGNGCFECVFITTGPITKLFAGGGRRRVKRMIIIMEDMCYERRRAEACVDESAHHALANAGDREIVGKKEGEQKGSARGSVLRLVLVLHRGAVFSIQYR